MGKPFLIASSYSIGAFIGIFFFSITPIIVVYVLIKQINNIGLESLSIVFLIAISGVLCLFLLFSFVILKSLMRVSVDYENKRINI
jgi:hypothetical protein